MHTLKEKLGARIKARRKELGLSQESLAELVNMDTPRKDRSGFKNKWKRAVWFQWTRAAKILSQRYSEIFGY